MWEEEDEQFFLGVGTTKDGALIVLGAGSNNTSEIRVLDATEAEGEPRVVEGRRHGIEYSIEHHGDEILVLSNDGAENFAAFRAPLATPDRAHWRPLVAHREDVRLENLDVVDGFALLHERGHASTAVRIVDLSTGDESVITPPEEPGAIFLGENLEFVTRHIRFAATSLISPVAIHDYDLDTGQSHDDLAAPGAQLRRFRLSDRAPLGDLRGRDEGPDQPRLSHRPARPARTLPGLRLRRL